MKTRNILKKLPCLALFFAALTMSSCIKEQVENVPAEKTGEFTFLIRVPGNATPSSAAGTRAITEGGTNDNRVNAVDILLFDASTEKFVRSVYCMNINETGDVKVKSVRARLPQGSYKAVILANSHQQLIAHPVSEGTLKATALAQFTETLAYGTLWNSLPGSTGYRDFPMWGEVAGTVTVPSVGTITVDLYRMLAKVNLSMAYTETTPGTPDFVLKDIRVYNYNQSGYLAPVDANWAANPKQPTHYASREYPANQTTPTALLYDNTTGANASRTPKYITTDAAGKFYKSVDEIFIFESAADNSAWSWEKNPCLVLGGEYKGVMGYYRIDFMQSNANIDILRNHSYNFSVEAVRNQGYDSPEEALKNKPENLTFNIIVWDDNDIGDIVFDGQYMLGIRPSSEFDFFKPADTQTAEIKTTYPGGWKVLKITDADGVTPPSNGWLTTDKNTGTLYGADGNFTSLAITVSENDSGGDRTGYIYIVAGKLETKLKVTQITTVPSMLAILDESGNAIDAIEFAAASGADPGERTYKVKWSPIAEILYPAVSSVANPAGGNYDALGWVHYKTLSGTIDDQLGTAVYTSAIDSKTGEATFTIKPSPIASNDPKLIDNPFYERQTMVSFRATGSEGTMRKNLILQQYVYNLDAKAESFYLADGSDYTFNVKSNRPWKAYLINTGGGMVTSPTVSDTAPFATGGYNLPEGTNVSFTTIDDLSDPTILRGTAKVKIVWDNGTGTDAEQTVDLFCASGEIQEPSNCYIVTPNATPILIPVSRANESSTILGTQINGEYSAELVWSDVKGTNDTGYDPVNEDTPVKLIQVAGSDADGYILVMPGSKAGNAVVAARANGNIVWSWHIWVIDSSIQTTTAGGATWMDRNLGASNKNTAGTAGSFGLLYQWGRKDPFPGGSSVTTPSASTTIYNTSTTVSGVTMNSTNTLQYSVRNPLTFITSNWSGSNGDTSWNSSEAKTIYDPCPKGYKVPKNGLWGTGGSGSGVLGNWGAFTNYGRVYTNNGTQYYPAAGCRIYSSGAMDRAGQYGEYWSATPTYANAYYLEFYSSYVSPSLNYYRSYGFSVRCVAE